MMGDYKKLYEDLVRQLDNHGGQGIYPMGHLTEEQRQAIKIESSDAYRLGWDDSIMERHRLNMAVVRDVEEGVSDNVTMLLASGYAFVEDDGVIVLNMNDTWGRALSWLPEVTKDEIPEVARLFREYGRAGLCYWHSCKEKDMRSEFADVNRAIDFVRHEEDVIKSEASSNKRAYKKVVYTLGE